MTTHLIKCEYFVINTGVFLKKYFKQNRIGSYVKSIDNYANFLKKPLTLGMFIPCDLEGSVLDKPYEGLFEIVAGTKRSGWKYLCKDHDDDPRYYDNTAYQSALKNYQEAESRVLFKGFNAIDIENGFPRIVNKLGISVDFYDPARLFGHRETISDLTSLNLELTNSALKEIYG